MTESADLSRAGDRWAPILRAFEPGNGISDLAQGECMRAILTPDSSSRQGLTSLDPGVPVPRKLAFLDVRRPVPKRHVSLWPRRRGVVRNPIPELMPRERR